jgi:chemotaxis protein methyltransferase CheR
VIRLLPQERQNVSQYIYSICAIALDETKDYLIEGRLSGLLTETKAPSFTQFINLAKSDGSGGLRRRIIDEITTNETLFFRDSAPFDLLRHKIVPEILDRRAKTNSKAPIRIWSAACSTGQELYSIAILLRELLGDVSRHNIQLLGTDISDQAVSKASKAVFSGVEMSRGLTDAARSKSFVPDPGGWKLRDEIRAMASFRKLNLMDDFSSFGKFDIVFCRNVAIYFNDKDRASLFASIGRRMEKDSYLVIGSMESLSGICPQFEAKRHLRSVFYQLRSGV